MTYDGKLLSLARAALEKDRQANQAQEDVDRDGCGAAAASQQQTG